MSSLLNQAVRAPGVKVVGPGRLAAAARLGPWTSKNASAWAKRPPDVSMDDILKRSRMHQTDRILAAFRTPAQKPSAAASAPGFFSRPLGMVLGMGAIGGGVSYLSGGGFFQGAAMGMGVGFGARYGQTRAADIGGAVSRMGAHKSFTQAGSFMAGLHAPSTELRRNAGFAGAGLGGLVLGGNRKPKKTATFNAHRGNPVH